MKQQTDQRQGPLILYLKECLRLLVWLYFKPFTLQRRLSTLPPTSPQWRDFLNQVRGAMTILSLLVGAFYSFCLSFFSFSPSVWQTWMIIELCFGICIWLSVLVSSKGWYLLLIGTLIGLSWLLSRDNMLIIPKSLAYGALINICINIVISPQREKLDIGVWGGVLALTLAFASALILVFAGLWELTFVFVWAFAFVFAFAFAWTGAWTWAWAWVWIGAFAWVGMGTNNAIVLLLVIPPFVYIWLFEYLWACLLYTLAIFRKGRQASWLRYLPYCLDESVEGPLPFMTSLIIEAYEEDYTLTQQTIRYLNTFTNQQRLAAQATRDITLNQLARCRTTSEIAAVADHLDWISSPFPEKIGAFLQDLLAVSQGVRAALSASSRGHQASFLNRPATSLRQLQTRLPSLTSRHARIISHIVQQWLSVVEAAQRTAEEEAQRAGEIRQVYLAGSPLDPDLSGNLFKGRSALFREIETLVLAPQPPVLLLYGGRRAGKTSTLKQLPKRLGPELVPLLVDLQGGATATTLTGLAQYLVSEIQKAAKQARTLELPAPDLTALSQEPFLALQTWFEFLERHLPERRFILCLDEFEQLNKVFAKTASYAPLDFLRYLYQHHPRWIVLFSGAHTPNELPAYWSDYLINASTLGVSYLQEAEARELIVHPTEDFPQIYEDEAVKSILDLTHCHPYLIQLLCSVLVKHLNHAKRQRATADDVIQVIPKVFSVGSMFFRYLWQELTPEQQKVTALLAQGKQPDPQEDKETIRLLVRRDIIKSAQEGYRFQVPLYGLYITSTEEIERP